MRFSVRYAVSALFCLLRLEVGSPVAHPHEEAASDDIPDGDGEEFR